MITILTTFKPFVGDDDTRQRNALFSWFALGDEVEVLVFGDPSVPEDIAERFNVVHFPNNWRDTGMPTVEEAFCIGQRVAKNELLGFINGDIILCADFLKAIRCVNFKRYLAIGQRLDSDYFAKIDAASPSQILEFSLNAKKDGRLRGPGALDYFIFPRGTFTDIPALVPGGRFWDNYMVHFCRTRGIPVVDLTKDIQATHQNHDYKAAPTGRRMMDDGPATLHNRSIVLSEDPYCCVITPGTANDASHVMRNGKIGPFYTSIRHLICQTKKTINRAFRRIGVYPTLRKIRGQD